MTNAERAEFHRKLPRQGREVRRPMELRDRLRPTLRQTEDGPVVEGLACVYDVAYTVFDMFGEYTETVAVGAAKKTLLERPDVRYLVNHEGVPLARTAASTLSLEDRPEGLWYGTEPLDMRNPTVQEITSALERRDVAESSFAFRVTRQEWNEDYTERTILEFSLADGDVSSVTYAANPYTTSGLRAFDAVHALATSDDLERSLLVEARSRAEVPTEIGAAHDRLAKILDELAAGRGDEERDTEPKLHADEAFRDLELLELSA